ncbi:transcriptional regulator [Salmonella enterica]|nr:transcriptional regulator [Salmonella enterica]
MDIWALSEKADFIANKQQCLLEQWRKYCNTLTQVITLSKAKLYQTINCDPGDGMRFCLFNYFVIHIRLAVDFNSHAIEYVLEQRGESNKVLIASAIMDCEGRIDNIIDNGNHEQVLEHYLGLIRPVYDNIYQSIDENTPLSLPLFQLNAVV